MQIFKEQVLHHLYRSLWLTYFYSLCITLLLIICVGCFPYLKPPAFLIFYWICVGPGKCCPPGEGLDIASWRGHQQAVPPDCCASPPHSHDSGWASGRLQPTYLSVLLSVSGQTIHNARATPVMFVTSVFPNKIVIFVWRIRCYFVFSLLSPLNSFI